MSTLLAAVLYVPLVWQIVRYRIRLNIASFILYVVLDLFAGLSTYFGHGSNWQLPLVFAGGCLVIVFTLWFTDNYTWGLIETCAAGVVVICCIAEWKVSGAHRVIVISSLAQIFAGLPQIKDAWQHPHKQPLLINFGYLCADWFAVIGAKAWTAEESLYPVAVFFYVFVLCVVCLKRFLPEPRSV